MTDRSEPVTPRTPASRQRFSGWSWVAAAALALLVGLILVTAIVISTRPRPGLSVLQLTTGPAAPTLAVAGIFVEPDDGRGPILEELAAARDLVSLQVYLLSDKEIIDALEAAAGRGLRVRVMLEEHESGHAEFNRKPRNP